MTCACWKCSRLGWGRGGWAMRREVRAARAATRRAGTLFRTMVEPGPQASMYQTLKGACGNQERAERSAKARPGRELLTGDIRVYILRIQRPQNMAGAKAQLVKWGNSQAVRIPKTVLEQANLHEGDELEIQVEEGRITIAPLNAKLTLESLVAGISPKNRYAEQDWGKPAGKEIW